MSAGVSVHLFLFIPFALTQMAHWRATGVNTQTDTSLCYYLVNLQGRGKAERFKEGKGLLPEIWHCKPRAILSAVHNPQVCIAYVRFVINQYVAKCNSNILVHGPRKCL